MNANPTALPLGPALATLFAELVDGPPEAESYMLNPGDRGLLRSLAAIPWEAAAEPAQGGAPIAAHVDHVRYGVSLFNRWAGGEANPFATADWAASWKRTVGSEAEWTTLREELAREVRRWHDALQTIEQGPPLSDIAHKGVIASVAHLAYHLGAIRQIDSRARGPKQEPRAGAAS